MEEIALLKKFVFGIAPLPEEVWQDLSGIWQPISCKRRTLLTAAGETEKYLYFVLEGVQRAFFVDEGKPEATLVFSYPYSFSGVADSFLTRQPSVCSFETLTSSKFLRTSYPQIRELMDRHRQLESWILLVTAQALRGVLARQIELISFSAEEKFKTLLGRSPHLLQIIPHKYLASYLGIDASTFSKLLGSVRL